MSYSVVGRGREADGDGIGKRGGKRMVQGERRTVGGEEVRQVERKEGEAGGWLVLDSGGVGR